MRKPDLIISKATLPEQTLNASNLIGLKVLAKSGLIVGRLREVRLDVSTNKVEGFIVSRGLKKPLYIGREYVNKVSSSAIILNMMPNVFLKGKKVISAKGKVIGTIKKINRRNNTNVLINIIVHSFLRKDLVIPSNAIKTVGKSIVLKDSYNEKQKYFWQKA